MYQECLFMSDFIFTMLGRSVHSQGVSHKSFEYILDRICKIILKNEKKVKIFNFLWPKEG